jgi:ABC-type nitrate/sulfonate/bicarbonate transport system permease component
LPLLSLLSLGGVVFLWWALTARFHVVEPLKFPTPKEVIDSVSTLRTQLLHDAWSTFVRVVISWVAGSLLGIGVGLAMVRSRLVYYIIAPLVESLRPVPPIALIPFVILWFGIGETGKLFLGALGCFMVMAINTIVASNNVPPVYLRAARSLGASQNQVYRTVILRAIVPQLFSGLRIGAALTFAIVVAAEFMGAESGIGALIMLASRTLNTPVVLLGTIIIGLEAFLLEQAIRLLSRRLTSWVEHATD